MSFRLDPGASELITLQVLSRDPTDPDGWLPDGTFTFRSNYDVTVGDTAGPSEGAFDWGFSLAVEAMA